MAFKELADLDTATCTAIGGVDKKSGKKNPITIEGYFIGTKEVSSPKSKTGLASLHVIQTSKGNVGVWGKTNLDQKMKTVSPGFMTRISFVGMQETKNNPMYKYKVEVDENNTIDVSGVSESSVSGGSEEPGFNSASDDHSYNYEAAEENDALGEEAPLDEPPLARAVAPKVRPTAAIDAARQAQTKALLDRNRNKSA